ncbi:MAG TPA: hypothetical protein VJN18_12365 [Polyangiaceae bacterium]|nr:hypothetical protein [Polyangiaceae bacterium]
MRIDTPKAILIGLVVGAGVLGCGDDEATQKSSDVSAAGVGGACEPRTCEQLDAKCGQTDDGCGSTIACGDPCSGGEGGAAGSGPTDCANEILVTPAHYGRRARSSGFAGGDDSYLELFDMTCSDASTCIDECTVHQGSAEMCGASECLPDAQGSNACVPPGIWGGLESIQLEDSSMLDMTQIVLASSPYRDVLLVDTFGLDVPEGADIRGITVEVRRAGDATVVDDSVRLLKAGELFGAERGISDAWSDEPAWVSYGGEDDSWGEQWLAADLKAESFGLGLSAQYTDDAGNTRAYVDQVRLTVSYSICP